MKPSDTLFKRLFFVLLFVSWGTISSVSSAQQDENPYGNPQEQTAPTDQDGHRSAGKTDDSADDTLAPFSAEPGAVQYDTEDEVAIDLDALDEEDLDPPATAGPGGHGHSESGATGPLPFKLKLFFDFLVEYEWEQKNFAFGSDHAYIMMEMTIADWLGFRADVSINPEFFEIIFNLGNKTELRLGKVLVPFGQNEFHHMIGGRVDEQSLFLPVVWADYGVVWRQGVYDGESVGIDFSLWVSNGFQESTGIFGDPEPSRKAGSLTDNNLMKGVGLHPVLRLGQHVVLGTSWYFDKWNKDKDALMLFYGADMELGYGLMPVPFLRNIRLRGEIAWAEIQLQDKNYYSGIILYGIRKAGYYGEISYKVLPWLILRYREGYLNADSRLTDTNDLLLHEPAIKFIFGPAHIDLGAQFHQILPEPPYREEPTDTSYAYLRLFLRY